MARFILPIASIFLILSLFIYKNLTPESELLTAEKVDEILTASGEIDAFINKAVFDNKEIAYPKGYLLAMKYVGPLLVLGVNNEEKWIEVDLSKQKLYAHEGDRIVFEFPISSGLPWTPTVTGDFRIWAKVFAQRMKGGSVAAGNYYDLPNVPYVQYFYKAYGLHGAYWHNDFGKPRSHGCVNLRPVDAQALYYWTNPPMPEGKKFLANIKPEVSTRVIVHGTTPNP